jgi:hypothetical protein
VKVKAEEYISEKGKCYGGITKSQYLSKAASNGYNFNNFTYCSRPDQLFYTQRIADSSESMYNDRLQPIRKLGQIRTNNRAIDANTLEMILSKDENYQRKRLDEIRKKEAENNKLIEQYKKTFLLDSEKEKLALY